MITLKTEHEAALQLLVAEGQFSSVEDALDALFDALSSLLATEHWEQANPIEVTNEVHERLDAASDAVRRGEGRRFRSAREAQSSLFPHTL